MQGMTYLATGEGTIGIADAVGDVVGIAGSLLDFVTGEPVLMAFFCAGFIGIGIGVIKKLKR